MRDIFDQDKSLSLGAIRQAAGIFNLLLAALVLLAVLRGLGLLFTGHFVGAFLETLGAFALPVEVDPFGFTITAKKVYDALTASGVVRPDVKLRCRGDGNDPYLTDGGNYILDCACTALEDPEQVAARLNAIPGVVEHGLFINLARAVIVGEEDGARVLEL